MSEYLAICPFCASASAEVKRHYSAWRVECAACGGASGVGKVQKDAIAAWNKRVTLLVVEMGKEQKVLDQMT